MNNLLATDSQYKLFIEDLKKRIKSSSQKVVRTVNSELIGLYYQIGQQITEKQSTAKWGDNLLKQIEQDLRLEFPNLKGFSRRNLFYMRSFYKFCNELPIVQQAVAQIPWGHICLIMDKIKNSEEAKFYVSKIIENGWSRDFLDNQIDFRLYQREGKSINNFEQTINGDKQINLVKQSFKDSYVLDFLELSKLDSERQLEDSLIENITRFMLELGRGFAYVGRQFKLDVDGQEFFIDLLFYNYILRRFIVIELKNTDFKPEYIGQLSFYMTAINRQVKNTDDEKTIGLLICKGGNKTVVEYTLGEISQPTAVASFKLPIELQKQLPEEELIINQISKLTNNEEA
jgi:predicted nuclease of restriction endonuclease-like (RecB) superfamily